MEQILKKYVTFSDVRIGKLDILMSAWWLYIILRTYFVEGAPCSEKISDFTFLYSIYVICRILFSVIHVRSVILEYSLLAFTVFEMLYGAFQLIVGHSNHFLYPMTGTFHNPGPYSAAIAMGMSLIISMLHGEGRTVRKKYYYAFLFIGCIILSITWSRSAFVAVSVISILIYWSHVKRYKYYVICGSIIMAAFILYMKIGSALGRIVIWVISISLIGGKPFCGYGVNGFEGAYSSGLINFFSDASLCQFAKYVNIAEYSFNDFIQLAVEQGLIGLSFAIFSLIIVLRMLFKESKPLFWGSISLILFAQFSYPFQLMPYKIIIIICASYAGCKDVLFRRSRIWNIPLIAMSLCLCLVSFYNIIMRINNARKAELLFRSYYFNMKDYYALLPSCSENKYFLFDFGKRLRQDKRYLDSNGILSMGLRISNDPMFLVLMGNNYRDMKILDKAEMCFKRAYMQMPNRLYPLFQLYKLYDLMNENVKKLEVAEKLRSLKPKVETVATSQMQYEIEFILKNNK